MTEHPSNSYYLIFGRKRQGKTLLARALWNARMQTAGARGVWVDRTGTNKDLGTVVRNGAEFWSGARKALRGDIPFRFVVQFEMRSHGGLWLLLRKIGGLLLVLDEADRFANSNYIDPALMDLVEMAGNHWIDIITTVQTPPRLHNILKGNADVVVTFNQAKRQYAEDLNREHFHLADGADRIIALPQFHYLRTDDAGVTAGRVQLPSQARA